jgi:hypothetical protein
VSVGKWGEGIGVRFEEFLDGYAALLVKFEQNPSKLPVFALDCANLLQKSEGVHGPIPRLLRLL